MTGLGYIFIGLIIGFIISVISLLIYDYLTSRASTARPRFNKAQDQIIAGLKEKKDAKEKEMTEEIEKKIESLNLSRQNAEKRLEDTKENLRKDYQNQKALLEQDYNEKEKELQCIFEQRQKTLTKLEEEQARVRSQENSNKIAEEQRVLSEKIQRLQADYKEKSEQEKLDFLAFSEQIDLKKASLQKMIDDFEDKQAKIIARFKEDEKVRNERDFYKIKIDDMAAQDIRKLKNLALSFNKPDVIYKLIWEVYYKAPMEALFKQVLGKDLDKGGIYKITNIQNEKVYIGRTVNFKERFRQHCKRGCGIDRIKGLLYDAMMEEGLENFTFEKVEVCDKEKQIEREKYWISFYHGDSYGYNQKVG